MKIFKKFIGGIALTTLALGAGVVALSQPTDLSPENVVKADDAVEKGQFVVANIASANVFGDGSENEMFFIWLKGVGEDLDYPDVDETPGVNISDEIIEGIGGLSHFTLDGSTKSTVPNQCYMNFWTRHQLFTFMPAGSRNNNTLSLEAGFRIPTAEYINGGAASYYTLAKSVVAYRQKDTHVQGAIEFWTTVNETIDDKISVAGIYHDWASTDKYNQYMVRLNMGCDFIGNVPLTNGGAFDANAKDPTGASNNVYVNDHTQYFRRKYVQEGVERTFIEKGIIVAGKSLEEWMEFEPNAEEMHGTLWPMNATDMPANYRPVLAQFVRDGNELTSHQYMDIYVHRDYVPLMDFTIKLDAKWFYAYNKTADTYYGLSEDIIFRPTLPTDGTMPDIGQTMANNNVFYSKNGEAPAEFNLDFSLGNTQIETSYNAGYQTFDSYFVRMYSNIAINVATYQQSWAVDHYEYLNDSFLINGVRLSVINGLQLRDGNRVAGNAYDAGSPIQGAFNFARSALFELTKHGSGGNLICFNFYISKAALKAYTPSETLETITFLKNFTYVSNDLKVTRLAEDKTYYLNAGRMIPAPVTEYKFTDHTFFETEKGSGYIVLFADTLARFGYNLSDKTYYIDNLNKIFINGKSIAQINSEFADNIDLKEYAGLDHFAAYGMQPDGVTPKQSLLTVPVITWAGYDGGSNKDVVEIIMHPKYMDSLNGAKVTVKYEAGVNCNSDDMAGYKCVEEYNAVLRDSKLEVSSLDEVPADSIIRNIGGWRPNHANQAVKNFDQTCDSLLYRKDTNGNTGLYFTSPDANSDSEYRLYLPGNNYKAEVKGYAATRLTFDYILNGTSDRTHEAHGLNAGIDKDGFLVTQSSGTTNFTVQTLTHDGENNTNIYKDTDFELINDGELHTLTLEQAYSDVFGYAFVLWKFSGEFFMSNVRVEYLEYNENLNNLVWDNLKMYIYKDANDACKEYYAGAAAAYNALSAEEKTLFMTNAAYGSAKARLQAWAAANGEVVTETGIVKASLPQGAIVDSITSNTAIIAVVLVATISLSAYGVLLIIKRRKTINK